MESNTGKRTPLWVKILVPILIIAVVGAIYLMKSNKNDDAVSREPVVIDGADFSLHVTEMIDFEAMAAYGMPLIVDYGATECIPCKEMAPVLETLNAELAGKAFVKFVDVWKYPQAAGNVPVQLIPTQFFFNADGSPFVPSEELRSKIPFIQYVDGEEEDASHIFTAHQGGLTEAEMREILAEMGVE